MARTTSIPWLRIGAESVAIVASILLAFAIDAWWADRSDRAGEREALAAIHRDFQRNDIELRESLAAHQTIFDAATAILAATPSDCSPEFNDKITVAVTRWRTFNQANGAVESLIASGRLSSLRDLNLRTSLAAWSGLVEDLLEDEIRAAERRDAVAEYVAMAHPNMDCSSLLGDDTFRALLNLRLFEERELLGDNDAVTEAVAGILAATRID